MLLRSLLLLLLCMNIGVAAWWVAHREPPVLTPPANDPGVASLSLLSELPQTPVDAAAELSQEPEVLSPGAVCLSIGPFETPATLREGMNILLPRVERIQYREVSALSLHGYRVFLPPAASRAQALEAARALAAKGISDYYVVTAGAQQNTVSLGIFDALENATRRRDEIAALGYTPSVEARTEPVPQWWIDIAAPAGFDWASVLPAPGLQATVAPCG